MKALIASFLFLVSFGLSQAHAAKNICYVYLTGICLANPGLRPVTWFGDVDGIASVNAARCLERAQEYKNYCRNPALEVLTIFQVDGVNVIGAITARDGKTYLSDGIARMTTFHN